jgi:hypothetical protein
LNWKGILMSSSAEKLRGAACRCARVNADVALLCESALRAADEIEYLSAEIKRMQVAHFDINERQAQRIDALRPALAAMVPGVPPSRLVQHSEPWRGAALALWPDLAT